MKKTISLLCLLIIGVGASAAPYLNDKEERVKEYTAKKNEALAQKNYASAAYYDIHLLLGTTTEDISTYEKAEALCKPVIAKYVQFDKSNEQHITNQAYRHGLISCMFWWYKNRDIELYNAALKHDIKVIIVEFYASQNSPLSSEVKYTGLYNYLSSHNLSHSATTILAVDAFIAECATVDEAKAKKDLMILNRIISPKLANDKEKWEPIVAKIRIALETY